MSKRSLPTINVGQKKKQKRSALRAVDADVKEGGGKKKQKVQQRDEEDDVDSEDDEDDDVDVSKSIGKTEDITFEFSDMKEDYFGGIRLILNSQISNPTNTLSLTEAIIQQGTTFSY